MPIDEKGILLDILKTAVNPSKLYREGLADTMPFAQQQGINAPPPNRTYMDVAQPFTDAYLRATMPPPAQAINQHPYKSWMSLTPDEQQQWIDMAYKRTTSDPATRAKIANPDDMAAMMGSDPNKQAGLLYDQFALLSARAPEWMQQNHPDIVRWFDAVSGRGHK